MNTEHLKNLLIADFNSIRNNYYITYGCVTLLNNPVCTENFIGNSFRGLDLTPLGVNLKEGISREIKIECFLKSGLRTVIRESFEIIHEYCKLTNQISKLEKTKWFYFTRILRNSTAHNFIFALSNGDKKRLPIIWNEKTITLDMNNTDVSLNFFSYEDCWKLLDDMEIFINDIK